MLFNKTGWLTVNQLVVYHSVLAVFKIRSCSEREYLSNILNKDSRNGRIMIPKIELRLAQNSFTLRGASYWNLLPQNIKQTSKIGQFKQLAKTWIVENISRFPD